MWVICPLRRTDKVKLPGLVLDGRAKKLPSTPRLSRTCSASIGWIFGWNHLKQQQQFNFWRENSNIFSLK